VGIPKGFPKRVGRVESRLYGFPPFPHPVISMACFCRGACHLWHRSYRSEAQLGHVEFSQLDISEVDAKEVFVHLLEPEIFK